MPIDYTEFETRSRIYREYSRPLQPLSPQEIQNYVSLYERGITSAKNLLDYIGFDPNQELERRRENTFRTEYQNIPYERSASPEDLRRVQEQLAQTANDSNLTISTTHSFDIDDLRDRMAIRNFDRSRAIPSDREILRRGKLDYDLPGGRLRWFKYFDKCKMKEVEESLPKDSIGWLEI